MKKLLILFIMGFVGVQLSWADCEEEEFKVKAEIVQIEQKIIEARRNMNDWIAQVEELEAKKLELEKS